jgi:thymidylate synthase
MRTFKQFIQISDQIVEKTKEMNEGKKKGLRAWFGDSESVDDKPGWVNVVTGGTCASDEPGEGVPKCVSSAKRASMTKAERLSASRRKKKVDKNQQSKSGAAKPTYVSTDVKEESDKKGKGSGTKDACYTKVKSRYSVWPSAYASGALVKCRKVGAANWGNK